MNFRDRLLALLVAACWGLNFPATHLALEHFPPLLLVAVRFGLVAVPTLLFVPRPRVQWRWLLGYGVGFGVLQFAFLYLGMNAGMPSGLASLVLQSSAPFTVLLGATLLRERLGARQVAGVAVAIGGLVAIAVHRSQSASVVPFVLTVAGGLGWALGNIANRRARPDSPFRLMLWMSVVPPVPMLLLSLTVEGPHRDWQAVRTIGTLHALPAIGGLLYIVLVATLVGSGIWTALMARHPSSTVAPFSLAVPVVGVLASALLLNESVDLVEIGCGVLVIGGVLLGVRRSARPAPHTAAGAPAAPPRPTAPTPGSRLLSDAVE